MTKLAFKFMSIGGGLGLTPRPGEGLPEPWVCRTFVSGLNILERGKNSQHADQEMWEPPRSLLVGEGGAHILLR